MKKYLWFSMLTVGCLTLAIGQSHTSMPTPHVAGAMQPVPHEKMMPAIKAVQDFLGLTDEQVKKWEDLQQIKKDQMTAQRDQVRELEEQLRDQLKLTNPGPETVGELVIKLHQVREEGNQLAISFADQFRALLTTEQMKKLETVEECFQLQKITGALFATGFLAPPPPPPPPPPAPPARMKGTMPHMP